MAHNPLSRLPGNPIALLGASLFIHPADSRQTSGRRTVSEIPNPSDNRASPWRPLIMAVTIAAVTGGIIAYSQTSAPPEPAVPVPEAVLGSERYNNVARMSEEMDALIERLDALSRGAPLHPLQDSVKREDRP